MRRQAGLRASALEDPSETERILLLMAGVQAPLDRFEGGCVDPSRDHLRGVSDGSAIEQPDVG